MKRDLDDHLSIALCLEALAWLATTEHDPERSPTLLGAADAIWRVIGMSLTEIPFSHYRAEGEAAARQRLPEQAFRGSLPAWRTASPLRSRSRWRNPRSHQTGRVERADGPDSTGAGNRGAGRPGNVQQGNRRPAVISTRTVEAHVDHILTKLAFTSRTQVAAWMAERAAERREERRHLRSLSGEG